MNISLNNKPQFTGQYITDGIVKRTDNSLFPYERVSVVELDIDNKHDYHLLKKLNKDWKDSQLSYVIYKDAKRLRRTYDVSETHKFYVITTQNGGYEKMCANDVLAQAEIGQEKDSNVVWLEYLQVKPDCMYDKKDSLYKNVGTAFTNFIKEQFVGKKIVLCPTHSAIDFYYKQGFDASSYDEGIMSYQA